MIMPLVILIVCLFAGMHASNKGTGEEDSTSRIREVGLRL